MLEWLISIEVISSANRSRKHYSVSQNGKKKQRLDDLTQSRKELWVDLLWRNHKNEVVSVNTIQLRLYTILDVFNFYIIYYNMFNILLFYLASILDLTLEFRTWPQFLPARPWGHACRSITRGANGWSLGASPTLFSSNIYATFLK